MKVVNGIVLLQFPAKSQAVILKYQVTSALKSKSSTAPCAVESLPSATAIPSEVSVSVSKKTVWFASSSVVKVMFAISQYGFTVWFAMLET